MKQNTTASSPIHTLNQSQHILPEHFVIVSPFQNTKTTAFITIGSRSDLVADLFVILGVEQTALVG